jgi:ADP-ribosylglycohydrolase
VRAAVTEVAHDGTAAAIDAVLAAVDGFLAAGGSEDPRELGRVIRAAVRPFDTVGDQYRAPAMDARLPSRTKSIEELPVALGFVVAHDGDARAAVLDAVNYGRDSDSIATMAGAICGGLGGIDAIPAEWVRDVTTASRLDLDGVTSAMTDVVRDVAEADAERAARRAASLRELLGAEATA